MINATVTRSYHLVHNELGCVVYVLRAEDGLTEEQVREQVIRNVWNAAISDEQARMRENTIRNSHVRVC